MFELLETLQNYFDVWYEKGYLLIAVGIGVLFAIYYIVRIFI